MDIDEVEKIAEDFLKKKNARAVKINSVRKGSGDIWESTGFYELPDSTEIEVDFKLGINLNTKEVISYEFKECKKSSSGALTTKRRES